MLLLMFLLVAVDSVNVVAVVVIVVVVSTVVGQNWLQNLIKSFILLQKKSYFVVDKNGLSLWKVSFGC